MDATGTMFHLDAVARSVPDPVLPPNALDSQISGILHAMRLFLDTDRDWILLNIEVLQQQISVYDALLDRIDEVRVEVEHRRDVAHKSMASYSSTLVPIRRLPSEILHVVFHEVQTSLWNMNSEPRNEVKYGNKAWGSSSELGTLDFSQGPWKLSHVCGVWRDIVLSYPQLWSHITLHYRPSRPLMTQLRYQTSQSLVTLTQRHCSTVPALQAMLLRSAHYPLDIVFNLEDKDKEIGAIQAFSIILEESCRWRNMNLQITLTLYWSS
ncbi:hypothetical protein IW261DRAFT_1610585 [Armillaria novae-zelandiae]|uniref:F-box domain-containing protein n=1 Tax=Armillaria novae-zelandiae TaxID=153914 RepID=A0AA39T9L5_9AGAR|nr:hypothetical protein IW261DRAFT_1610585 [Armillaria novae-zelandiae]